MAQTFEKIDVGYYWAKGGSCEWFNIIVQFYGSKPFLKVDGWDFAYDRRVTDISFIREIGEKINNPNE